jgi:hypothetical protein
MGKDVVGNFRGALKELYRLSSDKRPIHEEQISWRYCNAQNGSVNRVLWPELLSFHTSLMARLIMFMVWCWGNFIFGKCNCKRLISSWISPNVFLPNHVGANFNVENNFKFFSCTCAVCHFILEKSRILLYLICKRWQHSLVLFTVTNSELLQNRNWRRFLMSYLISSSKRNNWN